MYCSLYFLYSEYTMFDVDSTIENSDTQTGSVNSSVREYNADIDNQLPETVTLLKTPNGGKLYLVGTAHFSVESQNDVSKVWKVNIFCLFYRSVHIKLYL